MLLYIVRHGDPDYETDTLTKRGEAQAEAVGKRLFDSGINRIFSSPMGRARMTAEPLSRLTGIPVETEEWTHEVGDERLTTYPFGERRSISVLDNDLFRRDGDIDLPFERAFESAALRETDMKSALSYISENGRDFLCRLGYKEENGVYRIVSPSEDRVALFCHSVFARAWLSYLLHIPLHMMWADFIYTHTGVTVLNFENHDSGYTAPRCLCYSDMSHLYKEGLDMIHDNRERI